MTLIARALPGAGFVARVGDLMAVCADGDPRTDAVVDLVTRVAAAGGDGEELVRRATDLLTRDAAPEGGGCALGGPAAGGAVAVVVTGSAVADVVGALGGVRLSAPSLSHRVVPGPIRSLRLSVPGAGPPHLRTRLDAGIVVGAGIAVEIRSGLREQDCAEPPALPGSGRDAPFEAVILIPGYAEEARPPAVPPDDSDTRPLVEGVYCKHDHFNDPLQPFCQVCGISMTQLTHISRLGPRPSLGVLMLDDGTTFRLDTDYVAGREPAFDPDVAAGRARSLRVAAPVSGVSRRHLRVRLSGWTVQVCDLNSANGTYVHKPGGAAPARIVPGAPVVVQPGTRVEFGARWLRYESHRNP